MLRDYQFERRKHQKRIVNQKIQESGSGRFKHWRRERFNNSCCGCLMKAAVWCQNKPSGSCFCGCSVAADTVCVCWSFFFPSLKWQNCSEVLVSVHPPPPLPPFSSSSCLRLFSLVSFCQWLQKMASTCWTWQPRLMPPPTTSARPSGETWSFPRPSAGRHTLR